MISPDKHFESLLECQKIVDDIFLKMEQTGKAHVAAAYLPAYQVLEKALTDAAEKLVKANPDYAVVNFKRAA